jgi:hypothetical protein
MSKIGLLRAGGLSLPRGVGWKLSCRVPPPLHAGLTRAIPVTRQRSVPLGTPRRSRQATRERFKTNPTHDHETDLHTYRSVAFGRETGHPWGAPGCFVQRLSPHKERRSTLVSKERRYSCVAWLFREIERIQMVPFFASHGRSYERDLDKIARSRLQPVGRSVQWKRRKAEWADSDMTLSVWLERTDARVGSSTDIGISNGWPPRVELLRNGRLRRA